jgi:hypothetical protein
VLLHTRAGGAKAVRAAHRGGGFDGRFGRSPPPILAAATQRPITDIAFSEPATEPAWKTIPSWFVYGDHDTAIPPKLHAFMAERAHARATEVVEGASHVVMIGAHGHRDVAMTGDENDRNVNACFGELGLKVEPAYPGQSYVQHQAGNGIGKSAFQKVGGRAEYLDPQANRPQQATERVAQRRVIIDHENDRLRLALLHHAPLRVRPVATTAEIPIRSRSRFAAQFHLVARVSLRR